MAFPDPGLAAPSLTPWQLSYKGLAFGGVVQAATYQLQTIQGIDAPDTDGGDAQRPLDQGEFIGIDVAKGRDIVIQQVVKAATGTALDVARRTLGGVLGVAGNQESPLYLQLESGVFACMARPRKHAFVADVVTVFGKGTVMATQFHATDPRWYAAPTKSAMTGVPAPPSGGFTFPGTFPATFGGGGVGGFLAVVNAGLFEMRPVFVVTGPCINPVIQNLTLPGAPYLRFAITLAAGDRLIIDTDFQTVTLITAGSSAGSSRRNTLVAGSTWFNLPPGTSQIEFTTGDVGAVAGTLTCQSADAWMSL